MKLIYYVNIADIRDSYIIDDDGEVIIDDEGSDGYHDLLLICKKILPEYYLTGEQGEKIDIKKKRIFSPSLLSIVEGKPLNIVSGISKKQTSSMMPLTDEIKKESREIYKAFFEEYEANRTDVF